MSIPIHDCSQTIATTAWPVWGDAAFKSAIILMVAWAATSVMRRASAAVRHLVWTLTVYGTLALPVLSALLPGWRILPAWMNQEPASAASIPRPAIPPALVDSAPRDLSPSDRLPTELATTGGRAVAISEAAGLSQTVVPSAGRWSPSTVQAPQPSAPPQGWRRLSWQSWVLIAWGCGMAVMLLPILLSLLGLWRLGRCSARIDDGSWGRLLRELSGRLNLRRPVILLRGRRQGMPMTWGILRPKLLLPPEAEDWPMDRRRVVLTHELAHIKRGDFLTQLVVHVARAVYWFNPLIWMASKRIAMESEGACDDRVLSQETKASDYAEHLLTVAARLKEGTLLPVAAIAMARSSRLEGRLLAILDANRNRRALTAAGIILAVTLLAGSVLPLAMIRAADDGGNKRTSADPPTPEPSTRPAKAATAAAPGELAGTVTDAAGKPMAGVLVDVWTWCPGNETTTDQQGRFILKKLGSEPVEIRFSKEGFGPWYNPVQPTGVADLRVKLSNKTYFEGDVKGPDGEPVNDALIRADSGPKSNPGVAITSVWTETRSDRNGHYRLYVMPDKYVIQVRVPKVGAVRLPETSIADGETRKLDIKLAPGVTFQAIVVDSQSGLPIPKVRLWHWEHKGVEGTSDRDGKIAIDGMTPGHFTFNVQAEGYMRWWSPQAVQPHQKKALSDSLQRNFDDLEFDVTDDMAPVKIELEREVRITGVVQNPDGNPVAGATVAPADTGTGNSLTGDTRFSVISAKDGTFVMTLPASGNTKYNLEAHDGRKWANGVLDPIRTQPGDELKNVVIKLTRPAVVRGHVKDESGKPLVDRDVRASAADKMENRYYDPTTKTDKNGDFELPLVRPGEQFIQAAPFFWTNVPPGGMTLKLKAGETNSLPVTLKEGETRAGVELTAPASTQFPSFEEQLRRAIEKSEENPTTRAAVSDEPPHKESDAAPAPSIEVRGHVVDDATGKPISNFSIQGGRVDDKDPAKIVWGYTLETRSSNPTGEFSTHLDWSAGWRSRIIASGYVSQPVLTELPKVDAAKVTGLVIRMKRGRRVSGRVLDHDGKPVKDAGVYVVGNPSVNLTGAKAMELPDGFVEDKKAIRVATDADGAFTVTGVGGDAQRIAITSSALDFWVVPVPEGEGAIDDLEVRLPQPGKLVVRYDIAGAPDKTSLLMQLHTWEMPGWTGVTNDRYVPIRQQVDFVLDNLPPGEYTIDRSKNLGLKNNWGQALLDRRTLKIESGKTVVTEFVRPKGAPITGQVVGLDQGEVAKSKPTHVNVRVVPVQEDRWQSLVFDVVAIEPGDKPMDGRFTTERIPPGRYKVRAEVYIPETEQERFSTGIVLPAFEGEVLVTVPEQGPPEPVKIQLAPLPFKFPSPATLPATTTEGLQEPATPAKAGKPPAKKSDTATKPSIETRRRTDADLRALPESTEELSLRGHRGYGTDTITDDGIRNLEHCTKLRILKAGGLELTDQALESIGKLQALEELHLDSDKITGDGLHHLVGLKHLRRLDLNFNPLRPEAFATLAMFSGLTHLSAITCPVDDQILEQCGKLKQLQELRLAENTQRVTDRGLAQLVALKDLRNLSLRDAANVTDAGLSRLAELPNLRELSLRSLRSITPDGLLFLEKLAELRRLEIVEIRVDERVIKATGALQNLEELQLWSVANQPIAMDGLGQLKSLRRLRTNESLSSSAVRALAGIEGLESIADALTEISDEDLTHLARLPNLRSLELGSSRLTPASLETLAKMKSLRSLRVTAKVPISPAQWNALGRDSLPKCLIQLISAPYTPYYEPPR